MAGVVNDLPQPPPPAPDAGAEKPPRPSKSQRKREMIARQKLGERLVALSPEQIDRMAVPAVLKEAVLFARALTRHGARRRQMQRIGVLMREVDPGPIQAALARLDHRRYEAVVQFKQAESWRDRLTAEGAPAVAELLAAFPSADRQRVRQLVRNAEKAGDAGKKARSSKQLFRYLMTLLAEASEADR